jgi:hypothetical protein
MQDRTVRTLLALIAVALWGLLFRPFFAPAPAHAGGAQAKGQPCGPSVVMDEKGIVVATPEKMHYFGRGSDGSPDFGTGSRNLR